MSTKISNTTLAKVGVDEPIFVLRSRDLFSPTLVRAWVRLAKNVGVNQPKLDEALAVADAMEQWADRRVPD